MVRTTPFTFFGLSNLVKHHQLNYVAAELRVFGVQLGLRQTQALIETYYMTIIKHHYL